MNPSPLWTIRPVSASPTISGRSSAGKRKPPLLVTHDISEAVSMADQVIVLTRRPARIRRVIPITFKLPERTPMASRDMPEFKQYFNLIWKELNSHE